MKKQIFLLMIGVIVALASCSKSDEAPNGTQSGEQLTTFTIETPAATRTTVTELTRYIVEAYEGKNLDATPVRLEAANGSLTLELKKNTDYTFVFWADFGTVGATNNYYDVTKLQEVVVTSGKESTIGEAAYCLAVSFNSKDFATNNTIVLKNATAQLNFIEAAGLATAANSLTVKYSSGGKLNVATGAITELNAEISRTYANIGKIAKDGIVASDYILAPLGEKRLLDLKITFNTEAEKTITAVPFQQSYKTSVKGEFSNFYSSVLTVSDQVEDYTNNPDAELPEKLKIGSFYYKDGTWSSTYAADANNPCIGIVFVVNEDGRTGKIVGLTEAKNKKWGYSTNESATVTGIRSTTDGATATKNLITAHKDAQNFSTAYSAFDWVFTTVNGGDIDGRWYIPAKEELKALYGKFTGGTDTNVNNEVKTAVNLSLSLVDGANRLSNDTYWASTEYHQNLAWYVVFKDGNTNANFKSTDYSVRVVSAF